jgi:protein BUR2
LFLATKVEENPRKLPDLILMTARVSHKDDSLVMDEQSKEYWRWRDQILFTEEALLEALCFDFDIVHPYDEILALVRRFAPGNSALGKCAWAFINDRYFHSTMEGKLTGSHRTTIQIMYPPHVIAAAAFYFARKFTRTTLAKGPEGKEWWEEYGVKLEDLRGIPLLNLRC